MSLDDARRRSGERRSGGRWGRRRDPRAGHSGRRQGERGSPAAGPAGGRERPWRTTSRGSAQRDPAPERWAPGRGRAGNSLSGQRRRFLSRDGPGAGPGLVQPGPLRVRRGDGSPRPALPRAFDVGTITRSPSGATCGFRCQGWFVPCLFRGRGRIVRRPPGRTGPDICGQR